MYFSGIDIGSTMSKVVIVKEDGTLYSSVIGPTGPEHRHLANQVMEEGRADLVGMARQLFCDPHTLKKTLEGREEEILRCTWCRRCHISFLADEAALCDNLRNRKGWRDAYMPEKFKEEALPS